MKLVDQQQELKPADQGEAEWTVDFRYDTEKENEPSDHQRCEAKEARGVWQAARDALNKAGKGLTAALVPEPQVPPVRRRITAVLSLLGPGQRFNEGLQVFSGTAVCGHDDEFGREEGRREAIGKLTDRMLDGALPAWWKNPAGRKGLPTAERVKLVGTLMKTYFERPRPKRDDLGLALRLLRTLRDGPGEDSDAGRETLREVEALLARYPRQARKPETADGGSAV